MFLGFLLFLYFVFNLREQKNKLGQEESDRTAREVQGAKREREQQKLESTPKADFCRSRKYRIHKALAWTHTTVAKCVEKMLSQQKNPNFIP